MLFLAATVYERFMTEEQIALEAKVTCLFEFDGGGRRW